MEKYVIDLDKVLDELELREDDETSNQYNQSFLSKNVSTANSSVGFRSFEGTSILNSYDKIDVREADFSIQLKPPKILNSVAISEVVDKSKEPIYVNDSLTNESVFVSQNNDNTNWNSNQNKSVFEQENNVGVSSNIVISEQSRQTDILLNDVTEVSPVNLINNENSIHESFVEHNKTVIEDNIKTKFSLNLDVDPKLIIDEINEEIKLEADTFIGLNHNIEIVPHSYPTKLETEKLETILCDNPVTDTFTLEEDNSYQTVIKEKNGIIEQISEEFSLSENEVPIMEAVLPNSNDLQCNEALLNISNEKTTLELNVINIDEMLEEDLDKHLNDLEPKELENEENNIEEFNEQVASQNTENEVVTNIEPVEADGNILTNANCTDIQISDLTDCEESAINISSIATSNNQNEPKLVESIRPQSLTIQNVSNEENQTETSQQSLSHNNNETDTRGGLVRNIAYFERQEMPNGLTEEEQTLGKVKPFWIPDEEAQNCLHCDSKFTMIKRRHHCRSCGKVLCSQCCNFKAKLMYLENKEARVCQLCYTILMRIEEIEQVNGHPIDISESRDQANNDLNGSSLTISFPDPNNPAEYCSTISPFEQVQAQNIPPPTVMVPVGVLKRPGSSAFRRGGNSSDSISGERSQEGTIKQVIFSDGVRPGGDLVESPSSSKLPDERPISRTQLHLKSPPVEKPFSLIEACTKRLKPSRVVVTDNNGVNLPPIINYNELKTSDSNLTSKLTYQLLLKCLRNPQLPCITFGLTKNLFVNAKLISKLCCNSVECWSFASKGLATVGQDEIFFCLDCTTLCKSTTIDNNKTQDSSFVSDTDDIFDFPRDIFRLFTAIYDSASKASLYTELSHIFFPDGLFGNKENSGFLFTRPTLQCFQNVLLPSPPHLIATLIHKWEIPWVKVFPLRLALRLGYEYKMYPSPVISYANRKSVYFEIGHTIMNVLADFRNFQYTLSIVKDLVIHIEEKKRVSLLIPKLSYEKVCKVLSTSNEHVLAFGGNFSQKADSHLACIQDEEDDDVHGQYHTEVSHFPSSPLKITGASFIVFSGALKSNTGLKAKMNIVEDGVLVQIPSSTMEELRAAIRDMKEFKIDCCKVNETNSSEDWIHIDWVNDELSTNLGVRSQIDGLNLEGVQSARIFSSPDYTNERYLIRWIEVFLLQINENSRRSEMLNTSRLAESVSQAFCVALIDFLDQLYESGLTKISLRISLDVDKVGYEVGSGGEILPAQFTGQLDSALIPAIMENTSTTGIEDPLVIELLFYILLK